MKSTMWKIEGAALLAALLVVGSAQADTITVANASFEDPAYLGVLGAASFGATDGWTESGSAGSWNPTAYGVISVPDGTHVGFTNGGASLSQTTGNTVAAAGITYTLTVQVGNRRGFSFADYSVDLLFDGLSLASTTDFPTPPNGGFTLATVTYTTEVADIGKAVGIRLSATTSQANWDQVALTAVPLPAAAWLFGSALLGLSALKRRKA